MNNGDLVFNSSPNHINDKVVEVGVVKAWGWEQILGTRGISARVVQFRSPDGQYRINYTGDMLTAEEGYEFLKQHFKLRQERSGDGDIKGISFPRYRKSRTMKELATFVKEMFDTLARIPGHAWLTVS
ncbi:MAG: hypothetical protein UT86_C0004G0114 [Candidatus Magasanikbacteria bacterium GW2011_GWC2_40_17]|uniref:Uncharacterized protein n=1 Tax=Candidatus Magasanikbacteria bacterium GW2011_GWA2_42_32 TaxID=1619039 RepID=A0A0G1A803_9BACT|nr:MAG: hypothetical protein UT86_C0004G0114 [Candidatus Magasanikbacteria bacterium GW2011_GWC2_40_17]KKS57172.1 MAG: hypothetical protein UV20_C0003G0114 [Candidatus Magasanikbacteria bacterium GW2011_GWA2_42_32]OGH85308.1 MAG: hypothetical protein A2294_00865 [Candidatus Magasanikbacteria bacterium RIFOXYB2_FULL_38_10]